MVTTIPTDSKDNTMTIQELANHVEALKIAFPDTVLNVQQSLDIESFAPLVLVALPLEKIQDATAIVDEMLIYKK